MTRWTDEQLEELSKGFESVYSQAASEMGKKLEKALSDYSRENEQRQKALDGSEESRKAYEDWKRGQAYRQEWVREMAQQMSEGAVHANMHAADMINDTIPHTYAESANEAAFQIEDGIGMSVGFTLVNEDAVRYLVGMPLRDAGDDQLLREVTWTPEEARSHVQDLRKREVDYPKDMRWNRERFHTAITQGILQGESIPNIVKRTKDIFGMNRNSAIRAARTATTNAENAGRMSTFERAQKLGIDMEIEWLAAMDGRTRSAHRELDGKRVKVGESFVNSIGSIRWPGDPQADAANIWGCRCRANGRVVGFDGKRGDWADERGERWSRLPKGMTYGWWKAEKAVSRDKSYKNEAGRVSGSWYAEWASKKLSAPLEGNMAAFSADDIGFKPERPRKTDYHDYDEYQAAREAYRAERVAFDERKEALIDEIAAQPGHGYETRDAAEAWAERRGVVISSDVLEQVDAKVLDEIIAVNDELMDKYPQVFELYSRFGSKYTIRMGERGEQYFMEASGGLNLHPTYFSGTSYRDVTSDVVGMYSKKSYNEFVGRELATQVRGDGTFGTAVTHEFGHNVDDAIKWRRFYDMEDMKDPEGLRRYESELVELTKAHTTSDYSMVNTLEAFAEGFAEMECNPSSDYAKAFAEFLGRWL